MNLRVKTCSLTNVTHHLGNLCLYGFLLLTTIIFLSQYNHTLFLLRFGLLAIGSLIGYSRFFFGKRDYRPLLLALSLSLCWGVASIGQLGYQNYSILNMVYTVLYIGLGILVLLNTYSHTMALIIFLFTAGGILLKVIQGADVNHILLANSRNYISILLLLPLLLYYLSCFEKKKNVRIAPVLLYCFICILARGRGGIVTAFFFFIAILIYKWAGIKNKSVKFLVGCLTSVFVLFFAVVLLDNNAGFLDRLAKGHFRMFYTKGFTDNARVTIWGSFLQNNVNSVREFVFGSDALRAMTDGNLHNFLLQSYASFGLAGFTLLTILMGRALVKGVKEKDYLWLILFVVLILRAFTDRVFFQGYCEFYLYYFIFRYPFKARRKRYEVKND